MARTAIATKTLTVSTVVKTLSDFGFSAKEIADARGAYISSVNNTVIVKWDGTDPTATNGHPVIATLVWQLVEGAPDVVRLRFIRQSADALVTVTLER